MKPVEIFFLPHCPYCVKAKKAVAELREEDRRYGRVPVRWIDEAEEADYANEHDYYYVPTIYYSNRKCFEAHPGDSGEKIKSALKETIEKALFEHMEISVES